jgi:hypothetical protein
LCEGAAGLIDLPLFARPVVLSCSTDSFLANIRSRVSSAQ